MWSKRSIVHWIVFVFYRLYCIREPVKSQKYQKSTKQPAFIFLRTQCNFHSIFHPINRPDNQVNKQFTGKTKGKKNIEQIFQSNDENMWLFILEVNFTLSSFCFVSFCFGCRNTDNPHLFLFFQLNKYILDPMNTAVTYLLWCFFRFFFRYYGKYLVRDQIAQLKRVLLEFFSSPYK